MTLSSLILGIAGFVAAIAMVVLPLVFAIRHEIFTVARQRFGWGMPLPQQDSQRSIVASSKIEKAFNTLTHWLGNIAAVLVLALVLVQFSVVILRYLFSIGSISLQEIVIYFHGMIFMLGAGITLMRNEHVRLDIFYAKMTARHQAMINLCGALLFLIPFALTVFFTGFDYVSRSFVTRETSIEVSGLKYVYLIKSVILIFATVLFLQAINWIINALRILSNAKTVARDSNQIQ